MSCSTDNCKNGKFESLFVRTICNSLEESFSKYKRDKFDSNEIILLNKLKSHSLDFNYDILLLTEGIELNIDGINFPHDYEISKNIKYIIKNMYAVNWNGCAINFSVDEYMEISTFNNCVFIKDFYLRKDIIVSNIRKYYNNFIFFECTFEKNVAVGLEVIDRIEISKGLFLDCVFKKELKLENAEFNFPFFSNSELYVEDGFPCEEHIRCIENVIIENCVFNSNFTMNGLDLEKIIIKHNVLRLENSLRIKEISIENSNFSKEFELKNVNVDNLNFSKSNVHGVFDVYKSCFINTRFYKVVFEEFATFEYVVFGDDSIDNRADFIYVTFNDFSNFRDTDFKSGLNFSGVNLKQEPNFLNAKVNVNYTDRETLRIIKNSFEKVNNKIESNRFFIHEMSSYREEVKSMVHSKIVYVKIIEYNKKIISCIDEKIDCIVDFDNSIFVVFFIGVLTSTLILFESIFFLLRMPIIIFRYVGNNFNFKYLVLNINYFISRFGESYIRPIVIFLFSIGFYTYILKVHTDIFGEKPVEWYVALLRYCVTQDWFVSLSKFLNACAANVPLFSKALESKNGIQFISLLFFIWFGILTWQIIVAVKRNTQH
ncbi:hypothetical protein [Psychrobacter sp. SZ93C1]|uniref:hypothetical protein n=1 Tax=Psychrobacter sp. SZ93C1 TaxID=2792058 RepID=UPI0018CCA12D|nr:hypothetical protein [Psychrobacter sp. SZ93C1]MBH0065897.1 hypothetical protein [Psychrobacter sp. SZ93C1]